MAATPQFEYSSLIWTASATLPNRIITVGQAPATGCRIDEIDFQAVGTTGVGLISVYINGNLFTTIGTTGGVPGSLTSSNTVVSIVQPERHTLPGLALAVPAYSVLGFSISNAETWNCFVRGGGF